MSNSELINLILKHRRRIIYIFCLTALCVAVYEWVTPYKYESSVKIFIEDEEMYSNDLNLSKSGTQNRVFYNVKSTEMLDYLIRKFDLYKYYNMDSTSFLHYEKMTEILNNKIDAKWEGKCILIVTVADNDKFMAAALANEIYYRLNEMNKNYVIAIAEKKLNIYDQIISSNKKEVMEQTQEFRKLIDECRELLNGNKLSASQNNFISDIKLRLAALTTQLSGINDELLKTTKIYEASASAMLKDNITSLKLISIALPDIHNPIYIRIIHIILLSLGAAVITILSIMIYFEYRGYFGLVMNP